MLIFSLKYKPPRGADARKEGEMTHPQHKARQDTAAGKRTWRCLRVCLLGGALLLPSPPVLAAELTLGDALQRALANQALVQQAERVVAEKAALHRAAHADLLPSLSLAAGSIWTQSRNGQPLFVAANSPREVIGQVQLNIPLYAPQAYALQALAHNQLAVARYQARQARLLVAAQVTAAYYRLALWENERSVWREALGAARELLSATQKSYQAGTRSRLDLTQARLTLAGVQAGLDQATPEAAAARRVLALQTDYPASELPPLLPIGPPAEGLPEEAVLTTQATQAQPLLQVAEGEIQAARTLLRYHQAARLPVVGVMGAYGVDTATVPQSRDLGWQGALTLQMPIFGFGRNRDRIAAAQEHLAAMEAGKRALLLQVQSRIAADYGAAQAADNALRNDRTMAQEAQAVYEMTRKGYLAGALSALALQQAENNWVQARLKLAGAAIRARLARAQLALDSGVLPKSEEQS
jgi:outer membrane protein